MNKTKRMLSMSMVFVMITSMCLTVSAASSKSYDCDVARTITVETGSGITKPSIKFTCKGGGKAWAEGTWYIASTSKVNSFSIK